MTDRHQGRVGTARGGLGLRSTVALAFAGGAFLLSAVLSLGTYLVAQEYLVSQRERGATGAAYADASYVREGLLSGDRPVSDVLGEVAPPAGSTLFVELDGDWYSTSLSLDDEAVPSEIKTLVEPGGCRSGLDQHRRRAGRGGRPAVASPGQRVVLRADRDGGARSDARDHRRRALRLRGAHRAGRGGPRELGRPTGARAAEHDRRDRRADRGRGSWNASAAD